MITLTEYTPFTLLPELSSLVMTPIFLFSIAFMRALCPICEQNGKIVQFTSNDLNEELGRDRGKTMISSVNDVGMNVRVWYMCSGCVLYYDSIRNTFMVELKKLLGRNCEHFSMYTR